MPRANARDHRRRRGRAGGADEIRLVALEQGAGRTPGVLNALLGIELEENVGRGERESDEAVVFTAQTVESGRSVQHRTPYHASRVARGIDPDRHEQVVRLERRPS